MIKCEEKMMTNKKIKLKIGRKVYNIGTDDILMDNGASVRLTTQNGPFHDWTYTVPVHGLSEPCYSKWHY